MRETAAAELWGMERRQDAITTCSFLIYTIIKREIRIFGSSNAAVHILSFVAVGQAGGIFGSSNAAVLISCMIEKGCV